MKILAAVSKDSSASRDDNKAVANMFIKEKANYNGFV
jgi:hypothetical protein